jgi:hypothetical protein
LREVAAWAAYAVPRAQCSSGLYRISDFLLLGCRKRNELGVVWATNARPYNPALSVLFLQSTMLALVSLIAAGKAPSIIFILSDDLGFGDYSISDGVNRTAFIPTPNIQRMGDQGMKFVRGYSGQVCAPSRCALMTGE